MNKPNLIVAGVHKSGTTSLFSYLKDHPEICGADKKELHYFTPIRYEKPVKPELDYFKHFDQCKGVRYKMEASPSYFYGGYQIIDKIGHVLGDSVKIVVLLRNPSDRFISFFHHLKSKLLIDSNETLESFYLKSEKISSVAGIRISKDDYYHRALREGNYVDYIDPWIERYRDNFKIIYFEDLVSKPQALLEDLCEWLDLDSNFYSKYDFTVENRSAYAKNTWLHSLVLKLNASLEVFFRKNLMLKRRLRDIYYAFNEDKEHAKEKDTVILDEYYSHKNDKLLAYLKSNNLPLPKWD